VSYIVIERCSTSAYICHRDLKTSILRESVAFNVFLLAKHNVFLNLSKINLDAYIQSKTVQRTGGCYIPT
jgi:hypothetical protein